jgi:hypothetical protein
MPGIEAAPFEHRGAAVGKAHPGRWRRSARLPARALGQPAHGRHPEQRLELVQRGAGGARQQSQRRGVGEGDTGPGIEHEDRLAEEVEEFAPGPGAGPRGRERHRAIASTRQRLRPADPEASTAGRRSDAGVLGIDLTEGCWRQSAPGAAPG